MIPLEVQLRLMLALETSDADLYARWCDECGHVETSVDAELIVGELACPSCAAREPNYDRR